MQIQFTGEKELAYVINELSIETGVQLGGTIPVRAEKTEKGLRLVKENNGVKIEYNKISDFTRALGRLPAFYKSEQETLSEEPSFDTLGYMPDCSRNAVLSIDGAKRLMRNLSAMGYNAMMLYTEDTYEIEEYPYFGHMRGRFTKAELKELDAYALSLGMELIPCIQVLAHLNGIFRWVAFEEIRDIDYILNINDPKTYDLIDAMLKTCAECFTSRRINLGLDEAHNVGRGKYLTQTGEKKEVTELMHMHLDKVLEIAKRYGFTTMMWSDMFFRAQLGGGYYTATERLSEESVNAKPKEVIPIYWDYYCDEATADNMMECHKQFGGEFAFAGGAWKWIGQAPNNTLSLKNSAGHLRMCKKHKVKTVFTTGWGDKGGEASQFSVIPALLQFAEYCYQDEVTNEWLDQRLQELYGLSLEDFLTLDCPNHGVNYDPEKPYPTSQCKYLLFNDPLGGIMDLHVTEQDPALYKKHTEELLARADHERFGYMFRSLGLLCSVLEKKATLSLDIRKAYKAGDKETLLAIANERIPEILNRFELYEDAFRDQWYYENKTLGFEVQEIYMGGAKERLRSAAQRLKDYCAGKYDKIEEVEQPVLDFYCYDKPRDIPYLDVFKFSDIVTGSMIY
ncbi:MAG: beta-N-acetylhexosaminidase [Clostridiales bacterium]|nr:beta-N-acetylhexosaminidase [Clostridiales bacterium]